jgi:hypothetical protein
MDDSGNSEFHSRKLGKYIQDMRSQFTYIFIVLIGCSILRIGLCNSCTESCDSVTTSGIQGTFCGTDKITHTAYSDIGNSNSNFCYANCGVMVYHMGSCGCPNDCFASAKLGTCVNLNGDLQCQCAKGWTGSDCSLPAILNPCSNHGQAIQSESNAYIYCKCENGWTGTDCNEKELNTINTPWGTLFDDINVYTDHDDYKDNHPIWNISVLASVRITLEETDYINLLLPENLYTESYAMATFQFDNGNVHQTISDVGKQEK